MRQLLPSTPDDAGHQVLGGWNLGATPDEDDLMGDSLVAPPAHTQCSGLELSADRGGTASGLFESPALFQNFTIAQSLPGLADSLLQPEPPEPRTQALEPRPPADRPQTTPAISRTPPKVGDVVGGFTLLSELGRGAFARVFLAEQIELGNRLVALKVSPAEGDEPQMLARLQHAHIVPIHSVHDDPETGLRLLCMPYLGGANLAQVLEAAGARPENSPDRRSLVKALDEVSQRLQSSPAAGRALASARASRIGSRPLVSGSILNGARANVGLRRAAESLDLDKGLFPTSFGHRGSLNRLHLFWDRLVSRGGRRGLPAEASLDGRDFDQPARQFLREANTTQAAVWIVARLAEGLEHAHSRGLLHRDLKPSNILITADGTPMLLDFNLSSSTGPADPEEGEKALLGGTLPYMSPEHLDAFDPNGSTAAEAVDERSDLYSLGLILFEAIAGEHPFPEPPPRRSLIDTIRFMTEQRRKAPSLRAEHPAVPWSLDSIVRKCLDPVPRRRYVRARDLADDLNRFLDDLPLRHAPEPSLRERFAKWSRRNPRLCGNTSIAGVAALLILSLGGLIGLIHSNMQNLSTRLKLQVFRDDFRECRFLLNLASGPAEHLPRGIERADRALEQQRIDRSGQWRSDSWARRLTIPEQEEIRQQTAELILLESRARVSLAERKGTEAERNQALEWAVQWLGRAEKLDPHPPAALFAERARYYSALGRADLAANDRRREAKAVPISSRDFTLLGSSLLARGDLARAELALLKAIDLDPRGFWAWFTLGHCHIEQGRNLDAAGDFAACIVLEPKFAWPHMNRGLALARAGRLAEARASYDHALEANDRFAEAWLNRALVDLELNHLADAERGLERTFELGRRESGVMAVWAEVMARQGHREEAERLFSRLLNEKPDDSILLTARGIFRIAVDPDSARSDLRRALEISPRNPRAHFGLALLLRGESPSEALSEADAALSSDPTLLDALQLRALLRARLGDLSAADDAERLIQVQTPHRLYNASCALALLVSTAGEARLGSRALDLLSRALDAGFPAAHAATDPDLNSLRTLPGYRAVLEKARRTSSSGGH